MSSSTLSLSHGKGNLETRHAWRCSKTKLSWCCPILVLVSISMWAGSVFWTLSIDQQQRSNGALSVQPQRPKDQALSSFVTLSKRTAHTRDSTRLHTAAAPHRTPQSSSPSASCPPIESLSYLRNDTALSHTACQNYQGILWIQSGDRGAAAGTLFFQYMINQLWYADQHNLLPFVHLHNVSSNAYDDIVHGMHGAKTTIQTQSGLTIPNTATRTKWPYPGSPVRQHPTSSTSHAGRTHTLHGNGVWECYFEPVSDYHVNDRSCQNLPMVTFDYAQLNPGIQFHAPWSVRSWNYKFLAPSVAPQNVQGGTTTRQTHAASLLHAWYGPMRQRGHDMVNKYIRLRHQIVGQAPGGGARQNPDKPTTHCVALHIRHSDKGGLARSRLGVELFLPYVQAYLQEAKQQQRNVATPSSSSSTPRVYVATDSSVVLETIHNAWPEQVQSALLTPSNVTRSDKQTAVFYLTPSRHRTNIEILQEIVAMSQCQFLIHGFSAVSEAVMYLNVELHERSVDLEDPDHGSVEEFRQKIREHYQDDGKKDT